MLDPKDSLWIDMTDHSPYKMRKNGFTIINKTNGKETLKELDKEDQFSEK